MPPISWPGLVDALSMQESNGWKLFMEGCISTKWKEGQHSYSQWLGERNTEHCWAELFIISLFEIFWVMWDHQNHVWYALNNPGHNAKPVLLLMMRSSWKYMKYMQDADC
jgi:hypothetical protein